MGRTGAGASTGAAMAAAETAGAGVSASGVGAASACADTETRNGKRAVIMLMGINLCRAPGENKTGPRIFRPVFMNIGSVLFMTPGAGV